MKESILRTKSYEFALNLVSTYKNLVAEKEYVLSKQLLRSGTSIGANIREAQNAESKADFIHKFKISAKEADELLFWLELCQNSEFYPNPNEELLIKLKSINLIISKIIATSKKG